MAVEVHGTMIRIPQGDTGNVKFVADGALNESDKALFTIARPGGDGGSGIVILRGTEDDVLPVIFNGTQLTQLIYNGTTVEHLIYNGQQLY